MLCARAGCVPSPLLLHRRQSSGREKPPSVWGVTHVLLCSLYLFMFSDESSPATDARHSKDGDNLRRMRCAFCDRARWRISPLQSAPCYVQRAAGPQCGPETSRTFLSSAPAPGFCSIAGGLHGCLGIGSALAQFSGPAPPRPRPLSVGCALEGGAPTSERSSACSAGPVLPSC